MTPSSRNTGSRVLRVVGAALLLSGLLHLGVFWLDGSAWAGPISFRKPVLFGVSGGLMALSLAWVLDALKGRTRRSAMLWSGFIVVEVALITVQAWRRQWSHFNLATTLDLAIFSIMGALIIAAWLITLWWTRLVLRSDAMEPSTRAAVLGGLALLHLASVFGVFMSVRGSMVVATGGPHPELFGAAGSMHLPHAIAIHGLQVMHAAWWLSRSSRLVSVRALWSATVGVFFFFLGAVLQLVLGRAPVDLAPGSAVLLALGVAAFAPLGVALMRPPRRSFALTS